MASSDQDSIGVHNCIQVAGASSFRIQLPRFITGQVVERPAIKGDDVASFVVRLMPAIGEQAIQNVAIDAPLLDSSPCMLGHADGNTVRTSICRKRDSLKVHEIPPFGC